MFQELDRLLQTDMVVGENYNDALRRLVRQHLDIVRLPDSDVSNSMSLADIIIPYDDITVTKNCYLDHDAVIKAGTIYCSRNPIGDFSSEKNHGVRIRRYLIGDMTLYGRIDKFVQNNDITLEQHKFSGELPLKF